MTGDQTASLIYMSLLAFAIGGSYLIANRGRMGKMMQSAAIWGLIFLGAIAAFGLWDDIRSQAVPMQRAVSGNQIAVPRAPDTHFYLTLQIDGTPVRFIVDTGATDIVLGAEDAARLGIDTDRLAFLGRANTANGTVRTARVSLDEVRLGGIVDRDVPAWVTTGEMEGSLLGMSYLNRFGSLQISDDTLLLTR
jgi:aspartyl protease family protein